MSAHLSEADREAEVVRPLPVAERPFGRYQLLCKFASGGMANLFLAQLGGPAGFSKLLVIKRIHDHLLDSPQMAAMFLDEARIVARISHPNVVQVHELGQVERWLYIAMEYVAGENLGALLYRQPPAIPIGARIISHAAAGLHAAHELCDAAGQNLGVVHCDISPGNVLIAYDGAVKIADFGVARVRSGLGQPDAGTMRGRAGYMAPEQVRGTDVDRRADVFALGILLYETTTARRLFRGNNEIETFDRVLGMPIAPPRTLIEHYPGALDEIVMRALERDPDRRYPDAHALHEALEAFIAGTGHPVLTSAIGAMMREQFFERVRAKNELITACALADAATDGETAPAAQASPPPPLASLQEPDHPRVAWISLALGLCALVVLVIYLLAFPRP